MAVTAVSTSKLTDRNKPAYVVGAIDHALMALDLLGRRPSLRVTDLAAELAIGRATAHRLLQMLVFRGYAVQNGDRSYSAGAMMMRAVASPDGLVAEQRRAAVLPHLVNAGQALGETVHLTVLVGIEAVCLESVLGSRSLHTPSARDARYPAEHVSAGLALLASLPREDLCRRYAGRPAESMAGLQRLLASTRQRGFGLIVGEGGAGVTSVATLLFADRHRPVAAISCSAPTLRISRAQTARVFEVLRAAADAAHATLCSSPTTDS